MGLTETGKELLRSTAQALKGSARRKYMALTMKELGRAEQKEVQAELGWARQTIQKGLREYETGIECIDAKYMCGRRRAEERLPKLLEDIRAIVDGQSQTDPTFKSNRLYTRLTAKEVRQQLVTQKGYTDEELPSTEIIRQRLNSLGYRLRAVRKSQPKKR
jgi:hypothetical protein